MAIKKLKRDFFARDTVTVAQDLLGRRLMFGEHQGRITETEAYIGKDDPACHASRGMTPRTKPMFGKPGVSYVYFIYGMYFCLNIVTEAEGFPAAVLIRGVWDENIHHHWNGPGKLCKAWGITKEQNEIDLITSKDFYVMDTPSWQQYETTSRIGIKVGTDKLWRFVIEKNVLKELV